MSRGRLAGYALAVGALAALGLGLLHLASPGEPPPAEEVDELRSRLAELGPPSSADAGSAASDDRHALLLAELGDALRRSGRPAESEESFRRALVLAKRPATRATCHNGLGVLYAATGEMEAALDEYRSALEIWRRLNRPSREAAALHNLGVHLAALGRWQDAVESLGLAVERKHAFDAGDLPSLAASLTALGSVLREAGEPLAARQALDEALETWEASGAGSAMTVALEQSALLHLAEGRIEVAKQALRRAQRLAGDDALERAFLDLRLAEAELASGEAREALRRLDLALPVLEEAESTHGMILGGTTRARALRRLGDFDAAVRELERVLAAVASVRSELRGRTLRASWSGARHGPREELVDLWIERARRAPTPADARRALATAWRWGEEARARSLLEAWRWAAAEEISADPDDEVREIRRRLERVQRQGDAGETPGQRQAGDSKGATHENENRGNDGHGDQAAGAGPSLVEDLLDLDRRLDRSRDISDLGSPAIIGLEETPALLHQGTVALVYSLGRDRSFLWWIEPGEGEAAVQVFDLPPAAEIERRAERLHAALGSSPGVGRSHQMRVDATRLAEEILAPLARRLGEEPGERKSPPIRHVLVVPDGALHLVPFAALPMGGEPLLHHVETRRAPSLSVLRALRRREASRQPPPNLVALVADPVLSPSDPRLEGGRKGGIAPSDDQRAVQRALLREGEAGLERLPGSAREADAVARLAAEMLSQPAISHSRGEHTRDVLQLRGVDARLDRVLHGRLADYRVVHFATHAWTDDHRPALSSIVLSLYDEDGKPRPGLLRSTDFLSLGLRADLAVLSACRTGLGRRIRGEGLVGLTHSFFLAGADRVLVSLWDVNDRATADLMEIFYRELWIEGRSPAGALRRAQQDMRQRERWSDPYYWGAFVLQGDGTRSTDSTTEAVRGVSR